MALAPKFAAASFFPGGVRNAVHTVEIYVDFVCPFSKKIFQTVDKGVLPLVQKKYPSKVNFIIRQLVQPWHPSSTLTHEAALAVNQLDPERYWMFARALFEHQKEYFDLNTYQESRNDTYGRLAKLASFETGVDKGKLLELLTISEPEGGRKEDSALNVGNTVTNDLKKITKAARLVGAHVTPTVVFDGIMENSISSSWSVEQWDEWLGENVTN